MASFASFSLRSRVVRLRLRDERVALVDRLGLERLGDEDVLDELHRERRGARLDAARGEVADAGAHDRLDVDAVVLVEAAVLAGERGIFDVLRHVLPRDLFAVLGVDGGDRRVPVLRVRGVLGVQHVALRLLVDLEVLGQAFEDADGVAGGMPVTARAGVTMTVTRTPASALRPSIPPMAPMTPDAVEPEAF